MRLSVVIPAYNATSHIERCIASIFNGFPSPSDWSLEVIVVDDGSDDVDGLSDICRRYPLGLLRHDHNRGMCAARNTGFSNSTGNFVTLLDADDTFISGWFDIFLNIIAEWPEEANLCFTPCINDVGQRTCSDPGYKGWLTAQDMVKERYSGEYNPIFKGDYIRSAGFNDLGTRKSCGLLTYLRMAREAPIWITDKMQRHYHDGTPLSVTSNWTRPDKAAETYRCYVAVLHEQGQFIKDVSERKYCEMQCKMLLYSMLAGEGRDFRGWWRAYSKQAAKPWLMTLALLLVGAKGATSLLLFAKKKGMLRRYG